jgi:beta-lactamase superfamily II metal-dependent hydrolase
VVFNGGDSVTGRQNLLGYLRDNKIRTIDCIVAACAYEENIGGLIPVLREFRVGDILMPDLTELELPDDMNESVMTFQEIIMEKQDEAAAASTIAEDYFVFSNPTAGYIINWDPNLVVQVLNPRRTYRQIYDNSIVMKVTFGIVSFLLTGTIGQEAETVLAKQPRQLKCVVLEAPFYGRSTSNSATFIRSAAARYVVFSAGEDAAEGRIVSAYRALRTEVVDPGKGAVTFVTDGKSLRME